MSRHHMPSNIRVSVKFADAVIFAGEDVACTITFKNVAREQGPSTPRYHGSRKVTPIQPSGRPLPAGTRAASHGLAGTATCAAKSRHKVNHSVGGLGVTAERRDVSPERRESRDRHGRSLSILSIGTDGGRDLEGPWNGQERRGSAQPTRRPSGGLAKNNHDQEADPHGTPRPGRPMARRPLSDAKKSPGILQRNFEFPRVTQQEDHLEDVAPDSPARPMADKLPVRTLSPAVDSANPLARVLSQSSINGSDSERTSLDLRSEIMSNHSDETSMSEYVPQQVARLLPRMAQMTHSRNSSRASVREPPRGPETIMMGYAQMMGSFTLEGSLVNQAPFEEVKRKGVVGSHGGGGVVGVERSKRESGLFGSFGWSSIGESIGGILGGGEMSSIREMRGIANSKSIPLVSTPPSILFVDLTLAPGESRSYSYRFTLPRGLPPTHKGRAIKVNYQIVIGTQRAGGAKDQQIRSIDVPFRIFGGIDNSGEILGHDLMSPYVLLQDQARTSLLDRSTADFRPDNKPKKPPDRDNNGEADFSAYIDALLSRTTSSSATQALLSPTYPLNPTSPLESPSLRRASSLPSHPTSQLELINLAIIRSSLTGPSSAPSQLNSKFNISRSSTPIATLTLPRPAFRLGEPLPLLFTFPQGPLTTPATAQKSIRTHSLRVCLETLETVDPAIAMRSPASTYRYTRKTHAFAALDVKFARRVALTLGIPTSATPEFVTSGVGLEWRVRVEFATGRIPTETGGGGGGGGGGADSDRGEASQVAGEPELLEEVDEDETAVYLQGVESVRVDAFEVAVPIRVYGAVVGGSGAAESDVHELPV